MYADQFLKKPKALLEYSSALASRTEPAGHVSSELGYRIGASHLGARSPGCDRRFAKCRPEPRKSFCASSHSARKKN